MSDRYVWGLVNGWEVLGLVVIGAVWLFVKIVRGSGKDTHDDDV